MRRVGINLAMTVLVLAAGAADAVTTAVGLSRGAHETNSLAVRGFSGIGLAPVLALRVLLPAVLVYGMLRLVTRDRILHIVTITAVAVLAAGWFLLAAHNTTVA